MSGSGSVLLVLRDHDRRVRFRRMAEESFGLMVFSVANPLEGLSFLQKNDPPDFILLSSQQDLPFLTYEEFLTVKNRVPTCAHVPVVLLSLVPVKCLPKEVVREVRAPIALQDLSEIINRYCGRQSLG